MLGSTCTSAKKLHEMRLCQGVPGNSGTRKTISAKMHPAAHMSTPVEYRGAPKRSSGLRYHLHMHMRMNSEKILRQHKQIKNVQLHNSYLVTTSLVIFSGEEWPRARPKSANFICPSRPNNKFAGFKSADVR